MSSSRTILMQPTSRRGALAVWGWLALTLAAGLGAGAWWSRPVTAPKIEAPAAAVERPASPVGLAPSLQGTHPEGLALEGVGELTLGPELLRRFDYWLTTLGERSLEDVRADIARDLSDELSPSSLRRALSLRDAYLAYKAELARLQPLPAGTYAADALAQQLLAIRAVRARHFSADEVDALFGADDAADDHALARLRVSQDPALSPAEKRRELARLSERLSPQQRAAETEPVLHLSVADAVAEARARGANAREVMAIRSRMVGPEAAERLARVDVEQAQWQARVQRYLSIKQTDPDEAAAHKVAEFSPAEQLRLGAYE
jgi:lipase chaperone LimK